MHSWIAAGIDGLKENFIASQLNILPEVQAQPEGTTEAGFHPGEREQVTCLEVLPAEGGSLSHWSII